MRCDQLIGLNYGAEALLKDNEITLYTDVTTRYYPDGRKERLPPMAKMEIPSKDSGKFYYGIGGNEYPLKEYTLKNGEIVREFEQESPWSSGPIIFLALEDSSGNPIQETLWTDDEIQSYL